MGSRRQCEALLLVLFGLTLYRVRARKTGLEQQLLAEQRKLSAMQQRVIEGMASVIESRDGSTGEHVRNTGVYVRLISEELLRRGLFPEVIDRRYVEIISRVAPLHDVGKIRIPDAILTKPGKLTAEEYRQMKAHTVVGRAVVEAILGPEADPEVLRLAGEVTAFHHERWDGTGYPKGLRGTEIPLSARIMAVADVFDALTSRRVYKEAMTVEAACREMAGEAGKQFQRELVEVLLALRPALEAHLAGKVPTAVRKTAAGPDRRSPAT